MLRLTNATDTTFANLDASMFGFLTTNNTLYAAVNKSSGNSWFGATSCVGCAVVQPTAVPEPASMMLLGSGLLAGVARLRRRRASRG